MYNDSGSSEKKDADATVYAFKPAVEKSNRNQAVMERNQAAGLGRGLGGWRACCVGVRT